MSPLIFTFSDLIYHPDLLPFHIVQNVFINAAVIQFVFITSRAGKPSETNVVWCKSQVLKRIITQTSALPEALSTV
jgi:hypothetical protein